MGSKYTGNGKITKSVLWSLIGLALSLAVPSTKIQRYVGNLGVAVYVILAVGAVYVIYKYLINLFLTRLSPRRAAAAATLTILALIALFVAVYPAANAGIYGGSDREEALNIAGANILHGRYPYYGETYAGNPINKLPGAIFLALPFIAVGNSAYQNFFWLAVFFLVLKVLLKDARLALLSLWSVLALAPVVIHEVVTGGDLLANSIWVFVFTVYAIKAVTGAGVNVPLKILASVLLGIGLASRGNFFLILPLLFSMFVQHAGWKKAVVYISLACLASLAITLPFYIYDPVRFSAFDFQNKPALIFPWAGVVVPAACMLLVAILSLQRMDRRGVALFRNVAFVQALPVVACVILASVRAGRLNLSDFAWYGVSFLIFGAAAAWIHLADAFVNLGESRGKGTPVALNPPRENMYRPARVIMGLYDYDEV